MSAIQSLESLQELLASHKLVLINTYRGSWRPFCRNYLIGLEKTFKYLGEKISIIGVSVDEPEENAALKASLGIGFDLIQDPYLLFNTELGVYTGKGHGKDAYLQPAIFLFHHGEKVFEWIQTPSLLNMGGAISRITPQKVLAEVKNYID